MISYIILTNFKNFSSEVIRLGPFSVIVGANASGKSNIRDALRILNGIGCGYTLGEIFGGKYLSGQMVWEPIRGTPTEIAKEEGGIFAISSEIILGNDEVMFTIQIGPELVGTLGLRVMAESLKINDEIIYDWSMGEFKGVSEEYNRLLMQVGRSDQAILTQLPKLIDIKFDYSNLIEIYAKIRFLDLVPNVMRQPSFLGQTVLGDSGENLPTILKALCDNQKQKSSIIEWVRELTPMDVQDFEFPVDPSGRVHLIIREYSGRKVSAFAASDGTLRFLAILASLLTSESQGLYFLEEIDNGIHPSRLRLLVELIETQTEKRKTQVIATSHSPELLAIINDETFSHTSVVCRREQSGDAMIRPVAQIPNANELRESQGLGRLLAAGWMETALAFTEDGRDGEEIVE